MRSGKSLLTAMSVKFSMEQGTVPCIITLDQRATIKNLSRHLLPGTLYELVGTTGVRPHHRLLNVITKEHRA